MLLENDFQNKGIWRSALKIVVLGGRLRRELSSRRGTGIVQCKSPLFLGRTRHPSVTSCQRLAGQHWNIAQRRLQLRETGAQIGPTLRSTPHTAATNSLQIYHLHNSAGCSAPSLDNLNKTSIALITPNCLQNNKFPDLCRRSSRRNTPASADPPSHVWPRCNRPLTHSRQCNQQDPSQGPRGASLPCLRAMPPPQTCHGLE